MARKNKGGKKVTQAVDIYGTTTQAFLRAADLLHLPDTLRLRLLNPEQIFVDYLVVEGAGGLPSFTVYARRTHHSRLRGPAKGGFRMVEVASEEEAARETDALAMLMTWKTALANLPYGGAKGIIALDRSKFNKDMVPGEFPQLLTKHQRENMVKHWTHRLRAKNAIGHDIDIPAPDLNTNKYDMAWVCAAYNEGPHHVYAVVTGKPVEMHGSVGREEATGAGCFYIIRDGLAPKLNFSLVDLPVAIHGFGNAGSVVATYLGRAGAKIVGVADSRGGIYNPHEGIDPALVLKAKQERPELGVTAYCAYAPADRVASDEILEVPCHILIPAAREDVIHKRNASLVKARIIVEAANSPITFEAAPILDENKILRVPGILSNSGGVIVSYFEWVQDLQSFFWDEQEVHNKMRSILRTMFNDIWASHEALHLNLEETATVLGVARVAQHAYLKGKDDGAWIPQFPSPLDELVLKPMMCNPLVEQS